MPAGFVPRAFLILPYLIAVSSSDTFLVVRDSPEQLIQEIKMLES